MLSAYDDTLPAMPAGRAWASGVGERLPPTACAPAEVRGVRIVESRTVEGARTLIPPDTAVCDECIAEMNDPADRRFGFGC